MKLSFKNKATSISLAALIVSICFAFGQDIPIVNPSFELPNPPPLPPGELSGIYSLGMNGSKKAVTGWTVGAGGGGAGVLNMANIRKIPGIPPTEDFSPSQGEQIGYIAGFGHPTMLSQTLTNTIQPNTIYTLSVDIAAPAQGSADYSIKGEVGTNYNIGIYKAGDKVTGDGTTLLSTFTPVVAACGTWTTVSATFNSSGSEAVGAPITIGLSAAGTETSRSGAPNSGTFYFDNVRLTAALIPAGDSRRATLSYGGKIALTSLVCLIVLAVLGWIAYSRYSRSEK